MPASLGRPVGDANGNTKRWVGGCSSSIGPRCFSTTTGIDLGTLPPGMRFAWVSPEATIGQLAPCEAMLACQWRYGCVVEVAEMGSTRCGQIDRSLMGGGCVVRRESPGDAGAEG